MHNCIFKADRTPTLAKRIESALCAMHLLQSWGYSWSPKTLLHLHVCSNLQLYLYLYLSLFVSLLDTLMETIMYDKQSLSTFGNADYESHIQVLILITFMAFIRAMDHFGEAQMNYHKMSQCRYLLYYHINTGWKHQMSIMTMLLSWWTPVPLLSWQGWWLVPSNPSLYTSLSEISGLLDLRRSLHNFGTALFFSFLCLAFLHFNSSIHYLTDWNSI